MPLDGKDFDVLGKMIAQLIHDEFDKIKAPDNSSEMERLKGENLALNEIVVEQQEQLTALRTDFKLVHDALKSLQTSSERFEERFKDLPLVPKTETIIESVLSSLPQPENGKDGETGPQGDRGERGEDGKDAEIDYQKVQELVEDYLTTNAELFVGEKGDPGEKGEQGPAGEAGPQGEKGETGDQGEIGPQGEVGPEGPQGPVGEKGDRGEPGQHGEKGDQGEAGEQGPPGDRGERGEKGDKGDQGPVAEPNQVQVTEAVKAIYPSIRADLLKSLPQIEHKGVFVQGEEYAPGDEVIKGDSTFRAKCVTDATPPHEDWQCIAKSRVGRRGADGTDGEKGEKGDVGPSGVGIQDIVFEDGVLAIQLTDEQTHTFDVAGLVEEQVVKTLNPPEEK